MGNPVYEVRLKSSAQKELKSLETGLRSRIIGALKSLSNNPRPHGCRKLIGAHNRWRIRVGDYRVLYTIDDDSLRLEIVAVRHRSKAYD